MSESRSPVHPLAGGPRRLIRSPEQVALDLGIAGPMSRILAFSIDYGLILLADVVVVLALVFLLGTVGVAQPFLDRLATDSETGSLQIDGVLLFGLAFLLIVDFALQWLYFVFFELVMQGRSPGKAALHLRVVRDGGLPVTLRDSMLRNLLRMVDMLPSSYFVGLVSMVFSRQGKRLGDYAASTLVVREERPGAAPPLASGPLPPEAQAFRFDREQLAAVGRAERRLLRQTLRRLDHLEPRRREEALARATDVMCRRIGFEEPVERTARQSFLLALLRAVERG